MCTIDISRRYLLTFALIGCAFALVAFALAAHAQEESTIELVAIDAITDGNDATTLGPLDGCVEADVDDDVTVDIIVDSVPDDQPAIGFQFDVLYDPAILEVTAYEHELFLAAEGTYQPVEGLTDPVPDSDGTFTVAVLDAASNVETDESMETGEGTVVRLTFRAVAEGSSEVAASFIFPDITYPAILSTQGDAVQVDNIGAATVSVGEPCPADAEPVITPLPPLEELVPTPQPTINPADIPDAEGGGIKYGLLAATAAIAIAGFGGLTGGWLFYRRISGS